MTLEDTPTIVSQAGIAGPATSPTRSRPPTRWCPSCATKGVKSIVVLLHEGVTPTDATAYNDCTGVSRRRRSTSPSSLRPQIDAVVSGHTHQPYNCVVQDPKGKPRLLTSASSFGRMVTKLHLLIDPQTADIVRPAAYAEQHDRQQRAAVTAAARRSPT